MYSPYGSYSSMSSSQPMDIPRSSYLSHNSTYQSSCAFPSWPQRSSLTDAHEERATSYLSDDDLFPCDLSDDAHSISSSSGSTTPTSIAREVDLLQLQREQMAMQREAVKFLLKEKESRRQAAKKQRRSSSSKKSPKSSKAAHLDVITEGGE
ncbi:uncharacterized protein GGS25DRAFT_481437 [Hypoxylon fragiforme]|uniref:uncharacterized protein n=1 Tax=Hypoxylon fragiforme TaxID=63214 RepID=UPI0020C63643|nr:uncharacterized protein GGS25DRAFT_481437 [Hypoxylon fragiforme]KAI2611112.1 hypothetical protein GGS25DRAFT_481437 [Hypoxylon fragiforme]